MSAHSVRCPHCGKRLAPSVRICPACGVEQPLHVQRMRCHYCSRRVPTSATICPYCRHDPRGMYVRPGLLLGLVGLGIILALGYTAFNSPRWFSGLAILQPATPTVLVAAQTKLTVVTATAPVLATSALTPTSSPTPLTLTVTPTATPTVPPTLTATPTKRVVMVRASATPVPPPIAPTPLPMPLLSGPTNGARFFGRRGIIMFSFKPVELRTNEWYRVQVDLKDRANQPASWCGWSRGTSVRFPADYYDDSWQLDRIFRWHVNIATSTVDPPSTCAAQVINLSPPSEERTFYWY